MFLSRRNAWLVSHWLNPSSCNRGHKKVAQRPHAAFYLPPLSILDLCISLKVKHQVSHPYEATERLAYHKYQLFYTEFFLSENCLETFHNTRFYETFLAYLIFPRM